MTKDVIMTGLVYPHGSASVAVISGERRIVAAANEGQVRQAKGLDGLPVEATLVRGASGYRLVHLRQAPPSPRPCAARLARYARRYFA